MKLNIGGGSDFWGDVRLDINRKYLHYELSPNIIADAQNLPFRDHVFDEVKSSHLIEHLPDIKTGLDEMLRVSNSTIYLTFPIVGFIIHVLLGLSYLNWRYMKEGFMLRTVPLHIWQPNLKSIIKYLKARDFNILEVEKGYRYFFSSNPLAKGRKGKLLRFISKFLYIHTEYTIIARQENEDH